MIILWKADFEGDREQLDEMDQKMRELGEKHDFGVQGPFLPQDASLLYIFEGTIEQMSASGREFLPWADKANVPVTPLSYEVAQTPEEFWGE